MKTGVKEITELYLSQMKDILEFRAYTQLAYLQFAEAVDKGFKLKTILVPTSDIISQDHIKEKLINYESGFLPKLAFQHTVSIFESWFFDLLRYLLKDKNRLNKKRKLDVSDIVSSQSIDDLMELIIDGELNEIQYKKVTEWFEYLNSFVKIHAPNENEIKKIIEIKASRDILVHNGCIANKIYITKVGELARGKEGSTLSYDHMYVYKTWEDLKAVMESVGKAVSEKIDG